MLRKYYITEIILIAFFGWISVMNAKAEEVTNNFVNIIETQKEELNRFSNRLNEFHEVIYNLKDDIEKWKGIDALEFNKVFGQMRQQYGPHHLFEWRGRIFTTDIFEERNQ